MKAHHSQTRKGNSVYPLHKISKNKTVSESSSIGVPCPSLSSSLSSQGAPRTYCATLLLFKKIFQVSTATSPSVCVCVYVCLSFFSQRRSTSISFIKSHHCLTLPFIVVLVTHVTVTVTIPICLN
jgi:hypothetical protein